MAGRRRARSSISWRAIRRGRRIMLITDGLSDPWQDRAGAGHGLEVFIETDAAIAPKGAPLSALTGTWLFAAVSEISHVLVGHGGVRALLDELGSVSVEADGARVPAALRNHAGRVGAVLGVPPAASPTASSTPAAATPGWSRSPW